MSGDTSSVPATPDELTPEWLGERIGTSIDSIEVQPIGVGEGFMGQLARVVVSSDDPSAPESLILKLPTADPGGRAIGEMMRVWEREHRFYSEVAPSISVRVPRAYVNEADPPCLILEDLAETTATNAADPVVALSIGPLGPAGNHGSVAGSP